MRVIHSDGRTWPAPLASRLRSRLWEEWRDRTLRCVEVEAGSATYRFVCRNLTEYARCAGLFAKEPGTCA